MGFNIYNNLPKNSDDITFELLHNTEDGFLCKYDYEKDGIKFNKKGKFFKFVDSLSNIYSSYDANNTNVNTKKNTNKYFDNYSSDDSDKDSDDSDK